jgi:hypothetical protein
MKSFKQFLDKPTPSLKSISKKKGVPLDSLRKELKDGINHEKEHTTHTDVAKEIALDHLGEQPDYYRKLKKIEEAERTPERAKQLLNRLQKMKKYQKEDRKLHSYAEYGFNSNDEYENEKAELSKKHQKQIRSLAEPSEWPKGFGNIQKVDALEEVPIHKIKTDQSSVSSWEVSRKIDSKEEDHPEFYYHNPSDSYYIADGNHRVSAARLLGKKTIKGIVWK